MKLQLHTLSPLHIGTGEEMAPLDYVAYRNTFYRITQDQFLQFIREHVPDGARKFADWISEQYAEMKDIRDNKQLSILEGRMNVFYFCKSVGKEKELVRYLQDREKHIFQAPVHVDEYTRKRYGGGEVVPLGRVREAIKNGRGAPLVPGSSLKGALRTAVFYYYLTNHADSRNIIRSVQEQLSDKRNRKEQFAMPLIHEAFYCGVLNTHTKKKKVDDEKMDLFKLVRFSDGRVNGRTAPLSLAKVNIYLVERKQTRDRKKTFFIANQQPQTAYCETIVPGCTVAAELDFDIEFLLRIKPLLRDGAIPSGDYRQWIGIEDKVKHLFGLDLSTLTPENKAEKKQAVLRHLLTCLRQFSEAQLAAHDQWLAHFEKNDEKDQYTSRIRRGFTPVRQRQEGVLINLGYATGFNGTTALLYFLADGQRKDLFKQVMERFDLGNKPGNKGKYLPNPDRFPKSKRLVEIEQTIQPLGWLEILEEGTQPAPLPDLSAETVPIATGKTPEPAAPARPQYYDKAINHKKPPELDAVVVKSGRPNIVKVYLTPDHSPELQLMNYRSPLEEGKVIVVQSSFNKKKKLLQVAFRRTK